MKIIAHRGASGYAPENTIAAFKKAIEMNAKAIEFDVQMTKDHQLIVIHDYFLNRTTSGTGMIMEKNYSEILELDAGSWFDLSFKDEKVPLLSEVLDIIPNNIEIHIELKKLMLDHRAFEEDVLQMVKEKNKLEQVVFSSFDHETLQSLARLENVQLGVLFGSNILNVIDYLQRGHILSYSMNQSAEFISPKLVKQLHANDLKLLSYTVNQQNIALYFESIGVDGIFSNYPDILSTEFR